MIFFFRLKNPQDISAMKYNAVYKDPASVDIRFAMCFPDVYEIGMSYLGIQIIYDMLNQRDDVYCERLYSPWMDLDAIMRECNIPLFALESQDPIKDFDFLAMTLQYEMCYTNVLQILDSEPDSIEIKRSYHETIPLLSAAVHALIIRSLWLNFSIYFI